MVTVASVIRPNIKAFIQEKQNLVLAKGTNFSELPTTHVTNIAIPWEALNFQAKVLSSSRKSFFGRTQLKFCVYQWQGQVLNKSCFTPTSQHWYQSPLWHQDEQHPNKTIKCKAHNQFFTPYIFTALPCWLQSPTSCRWQQAWRASKMHQQLEVALVREVLY